MSDQFIDLIATASFSLGLFGAALCLLQTRDVWPFRALALVLLTSCASTFNDVPWPIVRSNIGLHLEIIGSVTWLFGLIAAPPLFWHYVCVITSVTPRLPNQIWLHALLPGIALGLGFAVAFMPHTAQLGLFTDAQPLPSGWPYAIGIAGELMMLIAVLQWGAYMIAITGRLLAYRKRLRTYVTNLDHQELGWVWAIIIVSLGYWAVGAIETFADLAVPAATVPEGIDSAVGLVLLVVILLNGLRQRPSLAPDVSALPDQVTKYEKSALTPEMANRIERKLRAAMTGDLLHRDPNLSLWSLARHIGASPNYISQTLNENIGESFFDFVNSFRIADAQILLRDTDQTVLTITYDVGFNSRSSFYTAFKKVTGQTPTAYRAKVSVPVT